MTATCEHFVPSAGLVTCSSTRPPAGALSGGPGARTVRRTLGDSPQESGNPAYGIPTPGGSLAGTPVDALAQEVGVAGMPRILLDHVDKYIARGDGATVDRNLATQVGFLDGVEPFVSLGDLGLPGGKGLLDHRRVGLRALEVPVRVALSLVKAGCVGPPLQNPLEPVVLDLSQVPDQAEQAQGAGRYRASGELVRVQSVALHLNRQAIVAEVLPVRRLLADGVAVGPGVFLGRGPHVAHGATQSRAERTGQAVCGNCTFDSCLSCSSGEEPSFTANP